MHLFLVILSTAQRQTVIVEWISDSRTVDSYTTCASNYVPLPHSSPYPLYPSVLHHYVRLLPFHILLIFALIVPLLILFLPSPYDHRNPVWVYAIIKKLSSPAGAGSGGVRPQMFLCALNRQKGQFYWCLTDNLLQLAV